MIDYCEIGRKIKKCRLDLGLSQEDAAKRCGISTSFYSNLERGVKVMSLETFSAICSAYSISADYLLGNEVPNTDDVILNILSEAKKCSAEQYDKYLKTIKALASVADRL